LNITLLRKNDPKFKYPIVVDWNFLSLTFPWVIPPTLPSGSDYYISIRPKRFYPGRPNIAASKSNRFTIQQTDGGSNLKILKYRQLLLFQKTLSSRDCLVWQ
jgi:hypothetical protein